MTMAASGTRDGRGRFVPGVSGNPAGKKPGTLNKATLWRQAMEDGDELAGRRRMVAQMREGDQRATMYILKQIDGPDRKVAAIALPIPPGSDVATVFGSIKAKMILGEVSPDEALAWFTALEKGVKVVTAQLMDGHVDRRMDEASAAAAAAEAASVPDDEVEPAAAATPDGSPPSPPSPSREDGGPAGARDRAAAVPDKPPAAAVAPAPGSCISPAFPGRRHPDPAFRAAPGDAVRMRPPRDGRAPGPAAR